jgi:predicted nucleotidyltransferase
MGHAHPQIVAVRYRALSRRTEIGTSAWLDEREGQSQV